MCARVYVDEFGRRFSWSIVDGLPKEPIFAMVCKFAMDIEEKKKTTSISRYTCLQPEPPFPIRQIN